MPVKAIQFDHEGQTIRAELIYNFTAVSDLALLVPATGVWPFEGNILLTFHKGKWTVQSPARVPIPRTMKNVIRSVKESLYMERNPDHIFSVSNFLC